MKEEEALLLLKKAGTCLEEGLALYRLDFYAGAINRAYYCIYNSMQAVLQRENIMVKSHKGLHVKFHQHFILTGILPDQIKKVPQQVENLRLKSDYEADQDLYQEDAKGALDMASEFYSAIQHYFNEKH